MASFGPRLLTAANLPSDCAIQGPSLLQGKTLQRRVPLALAEVRKASGGGGEAFSVLCGLEALAVEAVVFGSAFAWHRRCARNPEEAKEERPKERNHAYDTAKTVSMFLLITGHWGYINLMPDFGPTPDMKTWLKGETNSSWALLRICISFKMALLCLISGACSQGPPTARRLRNYLQFLVVPSFLWIAAFHTILHAALSNRTWPEWNLSVLTNAEWYLSSLVLWRAAGFLFLHRMPPMAVFLFSQVVALSGGYLRFGGVWGEEGVFWTYLQGDCTVGFFPYFALGYVLPLEKIFQAVAEPHWLVRLLALVGVLLWALLVNNIFLYEGGDPHFSYWDQLVTPKDFGAWGYRLFWTRRLTRFGTDCLPALAFLVFALPRWETFLTWMGPHTLYPYLFHHIFLFWREKLVAHYQPPEVTSVPGHLLVILLHLLLIYGATAFFSSACWRRCFDWLLKPTWLDPLANYLQAAFEAPKTKAAG